MSDAIATIHERISAQHFDSTRKLSDEEIRSIIQEATEAPSSFNIQHWRFIAVTDEDKKAALAAAAYGQAKVKDAAVTFVILGDLQGHSKLAGILDQSVSAGLLPREVADQ